MLCPVSLDSDVCQLVPNEAGGKRTWGQSIDQVKYLCNGWGMWRVKEKSYWKASWCVFLPLSVFTVLYKFASTGRLGIDVIRLQLSSSTDEFQLTPHHPCACVEHWRTTDRWLLGVEGTSERNLFHSQEGLERLSDLTKVTQLWKDRAITAVNNMDSSDKEETWMEAWRMDKLELAGRWGNLCQI